MHARAVTSSKPSRPLPSRPPRAGGRQAGAIARDEGPGRRPPPFGPGPDAEHGHHLLPPPVLQRMTIRCPPGRPAVARSGRPARGQRPKPPQPARDLQRPPTSGPGLHRPADGRPAARARAPARSPSARAPTPHPSSPIGGYQEARPRAARPAAPRSDGRPRPPGSDTRRAGTARGRRRGATPPSSPPPPLGRGPLSYTVLRAGERGGSDAWPPRGRPSARALPPGPKAPGGPAK